MSIHDNCAAVDRAVASLLAFAAEYPKGHRVVARPGRKAKSAKRHASSWAYFLARYGSLTWLADAALEDAPTFLLDNVTGERALLALGDRWDVADILGPLLHSKRLQGHGLDTAIVFHGGWGQEGFAFDTRITSPDGEHPIYRFSMDEPLPGFPHERDLGKAKKVVPFGVWLEREVARIQKAIRPALRALARPEKPARPANEIVTPRGIRGAEIGAPYKHAVATLGKPSSETQTAAVWRKRGLEMTVAKAKIEKLTLWYSERWFRHNAQIAKHLAVELAPWRSEHGIGARSTPAETTRAHGKAVDAGGYKDESGKHEWLVYETIGFHFFNGTLARIDVFRP